MASLKYQDDEKDTVAARDTSDANSNYKRFPVKPSMWDTVKESFEPTGTRVMLDQIRKRRQAASGG